MIEPSDILKFLLRQIDGKGKPYENTVRYSVVRFLLAVIEGSPVKAEDKALLRGAESFDKKIFIEPFLGAVNVLFIIEPEIEKRIFEDEYLLPELNTYIAESANIAISSNIFDFAHGASGMLFYLKSVNSSEILCLKSRFVSGVRNYVDKRAYTLTENPQYLLSKLTDTLIGIYLNKPDELEETELIDTIDTCFNAMFSFWQEVNHEDQKYLFLGRNLEYPTLKGLLTWCEGDIQKAIVTIVYSVLKNNKPLYKTGLLLGLHTLILPDLFEDNIDGVDFYSGALGPYYGYKLLYDFTDDINFLEASDLWMSRLEANLSRIIYAQKELSFQEIMMIATCYAFVNQKSQYNDYTREIF